MVIAILALAAVVVATVRYAPLTDWGRTLIERRLDGLELGRFGRLHVEGLRGDIWSAFAVKRATITDPEGVWLEARDLHVTWRPSALWGRRVEITSASSPDVTAWRDPDLSSSPPSSSTRLPVSVQVDRATVRLTLAPALAVQRGVYDVGGTLVVDRSGALRGALYALSRLHAGDFLSTRFDVGRKSRLIFDARAREAQGGALAGALGLAAYQPFTVEAHARGHGEVGQFTLLAQVGATRPAEANGSWNATGGRASGRISLAASTRLAPYQSRIGPEARFTLVGEAARGGLYAIALDAASENVVLTARGDLDLDHGLVGPHGVAVDARIADTGKLATWPGLGAGRLRGGLGGDTDHWVLSGVAGVERLAWSDYTLARLTGPIKLEARNGALTLQTTARGAGGAGGGLTAALLGASPGAAAEIAWLANGHTLIRKLSVDGIGVRVNAQGDQGLLGGLSFKGDAAFSRLGAASPGAHGVVTATWNANEGRGADRWMFGFDAKGQALSTGLAEVDRYLGPTPHLSAQGQYAHGVLSIAQSNLVGAAGALSAIGLVGPAEALKLSLDWRAEGPLSLGPMDITGSARGTGALTGTLTAPRADLVADFKGIDAPYLPLRNAHMTLSFLSAAQGPNGHITLTGASDYGPARAAAGFRFVERGIDVSALDVNAGGVIASGSVALRDGAASAADLTVLVSVGAFLEQGHANAQIHIIDAPGGAHTSFMATATDAVPRDSVSVIRSLTLSADGPLKRFGYSVKGVGTTGDNPWRIAGTGLYEQGPKDDTLSFVGGGRLLRADVKTIAPAEITLNDHGMVGNLHLSLGGGRADITLNQEAGAFKAAAALSNLSLALFDPDYIGRLDGTLTLAGRDAALGGTLDARLTGVGGRDLKGSPPLDGSFKANLAGSAITVAADMANSQGSKAHVDLILPAESSASPFRIAVNRQRSMSGHFVIDGEVRPLWDLTMGGGRSLAGHLRAAGTLAGTLADPRALGTASLENGRFQDSDTGLRLEAVSLAATLQDNSIDVTQFTGCDTGRGTLNGSGRVNLAREGASSFRLDLRGFRLIDNDVGQATASGLISVNRAADGKVQLSGDLKIDRAQLAPNPPVPSGVVPMEVIEVHRPIDLDAPSSAPVAHEAPIDLNIHLSAPGGVFIKGRGLNVEVSLDAKVTGRTNDPQLSGVARVVRGDYDFAGRRFQFDDRGVVYLGSTPETIRLDLIATRDDPTLTAMIKITGTAAKPIVTLSSTPVLPKDEVLSQVLFGASAAQLSGLQAAQLASALSGLAGGGGFDIIGGLRSFAHLDRLAVSGDAVTGTSVAGGKYLTDKVYLEISGGGREGPGAQVEWRVRRHLAIISKVTSQGDSQISVRWRKN